MLGRLFVESSGLIPHPVNRNDRIGMLHKAWGYVFTSHVRGAYYEFGVYRGDRFLNSWEVYKHYLNRLEQQLLSDELWRREMVEEYSKYAHNFYGFDTFEGMPDNKEDPELFKKGTFVDSLENVKNKLNNKGLRYCLYKGLFEDLKDETIDKLEPVAIINIDCDIYQSAASAFNKVKSKIQQGTILMMDDYNCFSASDKKGERRALREFLVKNNHIRCEPWHAYLYAGQSFICHIKE